MFFEKNYEQSLISSNKRNVPSPKKVVIFEYLKAESKQMLNLEY